MDSMVISSKLLKRAIENLARRVIRKKLGKNVTIRFPSDIELHSENNGEILNVRMTLDVTAFTNDIFSLFAKEE